MQDHHAPHAWTNALASETSPYLLQHAHNPVNWRPWGETALALARNENRPIFLSIGYSACHWCHVMERESFENEAIARILNDQFVAIKVDREERPDIDSIYMSSVQMMTGSGGWPLSVFLTPDLKPFFGGTYFPPDDRYGKPGFGHLLGQLAAAWKTDRNNILTGAASITDALRANAARNDAAGHLTHASLDEAITSFSNAFDPEWGGFGRAPKFPPAGALGFLLRRYAESGDAHVLTMVTTTLDRMAYGGMYDQLGGGFHRYSVDPIWLVPHFEKMLYDNALLAHVYLEAYQVTGRPIYRRVATETLDYVLRDMTDATGAFHAAEDADSKGHEGKFYVWSRAEIIDILGSEDGAFLCTAYGVTEKGNFEGKNILSIDRGDDAPDGAEGKRLAGLRETLRLKRNGRVHPGKDDKILVAWNGLMISSLAKGHQVLGNSRYLAAAEGAARFILDTLQTDAGLLHTYRDGKARIPAYLDDYAALANACLDLYESTFDQAWLTHARSLTDGMLARFHDVDDGGFYYTSSQHRDLLVRSKPYEDGSIPSGNSLAIEPLVRLAQLHDDAPYRQAAERAIASAAALAQRYPRAFPYYLRVAQRQLAPPMEIAIIGETNTADTQALLKTVRERFIPNMTVVVAQPGDNATTSGAKIPLLVGRGMVSSNATAYVCRDNTCGAPLTQPADLREALGQ